jgi:hypothetical protein
MPLLVRLRAEGDFKGSADLRAEMIRRLIDGPVAISELASIDGADISVVQSLIDLCKPRRSQVVALAAGSRIF